MRLRRGKSAATLLLVLISLFTFTSLYYYVSPVNPLDLLPPVQGAPNPLVLNPTSGVVGVSVAVSGSGFSLTDTSTCILTGSIVTTPGICALSGGVMSDSFTVGPAPAGTYTIQVQGSTGDSATGTFTITGPEITLTPSSGLAGTSVSVSGSGFATTDTGVCATFSGTIIASAPAKVCTISGGSISSGSFTVLSTASPGTYIITVSGSPAGDVASAIFTVTTPSTSITLVPNAGPAGTAVSITGTGFLPTDNGCSISGSIVATLPAPTCSVSGGVLSAATFTVTNTAVAGSYIIGVTGSTGLTNDASAAAIFTVTGHPTVITLNPTSGVVGVSVAVSGSGFSLSDISCILTGSIVTTPGICTISGGVMSDSFIVGPAPAGTYSIQIQGSTGDSASATFTITGPAITLTPSSGLAGTSVSVSGSGFATTDTGVCGLSSPIIASAPAKVCTISGGSISAGSFTVLSTATPGTYTITVSGAPAGDVATATFTVTTPSTAITLTPNAGPAGTAVSITGTGFKPTDNGCSISGSIVAVAPAPTCTVSGGVLSAATFSVANAAVVGAYLITVTGSTGATNDASAAATFTVTAPTPSISLNPAIGAAGTTVTVTGTGFSASDTTCTITSSGSNAILPGGTPVSCTITSGAITGTNTFIVAAAPAGTYTVTVTGNPYSDFAKATFTVTGPSISVSPTNGPVSTQVTVTGSNFAAADTTCTITDSDANAVIGGVALACVIASGTVNPKTFTVGPVPAGTYTITVTGHTASDVASTTFTVTAGLTPTITLSPASSQVGATVHVTGTDFSSADTTCTLTPSIVALFSGGATAYTCTVSAGTLSGSFVVGNVLPSAGPFHVTATGTPASDSAAASFNALPPTITLTPSSGTSPTTISVTGVGFQTTDTSCSFSGTPVTGTGSCTISNGAITGSFVVKTGTAAGSYPISVTTVGGTDTGLAVATFMVTLSSQVITLTPSSAQVGATVHVSGSGFSTGDTTCTLTGSVVGSVTSAVCSLSGGILSGSFVIGNVAPVPDTITATPSPGTDTAFTSLTILNPTITLTPTSGPVGTTFSVTGSGFWTTDACTGGVFTPGAGLTVASSSCTITGGSLTGTFVVGPPTVPGSYTISATGTLSGDVATANVQITATSPVLTLTPTSAPVGATVLVTGTGFSTGDTSCTFSVSIVISTSSCSISGGKVTASFVAKQVAYAPYVITVTGNSGGDSASVTFNLVGPTINMIPNSGLIGSTVQVTGSDFALSDTSCTFTGIVFSSFTCSIVSGTLAGSFIVANQPVGLKSVVATGNTASDASSPSPYTVVTNAATVTFNPSSAQVGTQVTMTGSGFTSTDTTCTITVAPPVKAGTTTCIISGGSVSGGFTVDNVAPSAYAITVTGTPSGVAALAPFVVVAPSITVSPTSGPQGSTVVVKGSGFYTTDTSCTLTAAPFVTSAGSCVVSNGSFTTSFVVGSVASGAIYSVTAKGNVGPPLTDVASASFLVTAGTPTLKLTPGTGPPGISVSATVTGFSSTDTLITFTSSPTGLFTGPVTCVPTNGACTISPPFTVAALASGGYTVIATGTPFGDAASAPFSVGSTTANSITLSSTSGSPGTLVTFSGTLSTVLTPDTTCSVGSGTGSSLSYSTTSCVIVSFSGTSPAPYVNSYSGSFVVGNNAPGTYTVRISGSGGSSNSNNPNYVDATYVVTAPQIVATPNSGRTGITVGISGSGFSFADNTCTLSSTTNGAIVLNGACSINGGTGVATASFTVGNVQAGTYTIQVNGNTGDFATTTFTVLTGPTITISPTSGRIGIIVTVTGSGFLASDNTCTVGGSSAQQVTSCSITPGSGSPTGSFTVANVQPGPYLVTISGSGGDSAQTTFTVLSGPQIVLTPTAGPTGTSVQVTGTGFLINDNSCTIGSSTGVAQNSGCSITIGTGAVSGSFIVGNTSPGTSVITVSGNGGDSAQATFTVTTGPTIILTPTSGAVGTAVTFTGAGFLLTDNSCTVSGNSAVVTSGACTVTAGSGKPSGSFTVGNVANGQSYIVTVSGNGGDSGQATFLVTSVLVPTISLVPPDGPGGTRVTVSGNNFNQADVTCQLSSTNAGLLASSSCSISSGTVAGSFTVGTGAASGTTKVTVTGSSGDSADVNFIVDAVPQIQLGTGTSYPGAAISGTVTPGVTVYVSLVAGTVFSSGDNTCTLSSTPGGLFSGATGCSLLSNGASLLGTQFIIAAGAAGPYTVTVTGTSGDKASSTINVAATTGLTLDPSSSGSPGSTVTFRATGLNPSDTSCSVQSLPTTVLISNPTCTISSGQIATGTFQIGNLATGNLQYTVQVVGLPVNDVVEATMTIIPVISVVPASGSVGTVFSFTGLGYSSTAATCTATITPSTTSFSSVTCGISSSGHVQGSFIPNAGTAPGNYAVQVCDNASPQECASTFAQVGSSSAQLTISPQVGLQTQSGSATGSGFNPSDTSCTITASGAGPASTLFATPPACNISGGLAGSSFTISANAIPGLYLITITGQPYGDFASNFISIAYVSTASVTSTSTTITSTTSESTTTTSYGTSYSLSTTTIQTTAPSTQVFTNSVYSTVTPGYPTGTTTYIVVTSSTPTITTVTSISYYTTTVPFGQPIITPVYSLSEYWGIIGMLILLIPLLLRRLFE